MKKKILSYLLGLIIVSPIFADCSSCDCDATAKSYLSVRPHYQPWSPEYFAGNKSNRVRAKEGGINGTFEFAILGSKSTRSDDLARYFLPNCGTSVRAGNNIAAVDRSDTDDIISVGQNDFDIFAENFGVITNNDQFLSEICLKPEQSVVGFGVHYRQSFWQNEECGRGFWAAISFPVVRVKNNLNFCETIITPGDGAVDDADIPVYDSMTAAFNQDSWLYGKIPSESLSKTGVADIQLMLGYEWLDHEPYHLETYIGALIPTGNTPKAEYLFEPVVGWGHHPGITWGGNVGLHIWEDEYSERVLRIEYGMHSQFLFSKKQKRSLDLKNRPWSRYLPVYTSEEAAQEAFNAGSSTLNKTPGINVFTREVKVSPGYNHNITTALCYQHCALDLEVGYNLFLRDGECLKLACPFESGIALAAREGAGDTNPVRTINGNPLLDQFPEFGPSVSVAGYESSIIQQSDLDLNSAASPCLISHTIYGALGYNWDVCAYPAFINGGASYEFTNSTNASVNRWTVWVKAGLSF